ncbi:type II toxin-antitoxin system RelE/ParE family toxin [Asticcacaulis excentricus]|uniref:Plasmid stabilization system n=1 Tax=Asticcacaulis excentricus (strain ATCC 15261 / DSM 4724 / KCTC 12464 / NCIMB 9791 / VKM B-1370 / CB 48) TaxID=573065 RepID=E8RR02_ASTEC|nr:type II toxin-antitoxin system RelE/ParE family toxin [Asticcacaulis excentricus]ADU12265.1 plasmid stabilization system [Asticcacaulis excentricus CB 48]
MLALEWRSAARADLLAIIDYISDNNPDAAQRLKDIIETKVAKLQHRLKLFRLGRVSETREMTVRPIYVVIYTFDAEKISTLRVLHTARQWPET